MENNKSKIKNKKLEATASPPVPAKTESVAFGKYLKISPTKVRDFTDLIRGKRVAEAETTLKFSGTRGGQTVLAVLRSASANAGPGLNKETWVVKEVRADQGPIFRRRIDPKSRGSRGLITTPSTHLTIRLGLPAERGSHGA
ncbi:MAG: uL22 family ribosomal protein [Patescibacteria group bacterium]